MIRVPVLATALLFSAGLSLAACKEEEAKGNLPPAQEVSASTEGQFCGMLLTEHPGPKGQIFVRDKPQPFWFATVRDTFAFTMLPEMPKNLVAIYVNDMGRARNWDQPEPGTWVNARNAYYVIGSRRRSGMGGDEAVPFAEAEAAQRFAAENGGRVVRFTDMPHDYILADQNG
jgi:copper chaperone NosL